MNQNIKQYLKFIEDWERIHTETYLLLLRNAAGKKAAARKRICANDEDLDEAIKAARKYMRIILGMGGAFTAELPFINRKS